MITRENYEIWMLDYAEGRLDATQQKLFLAFLEQNPDLKKELEAFDQVSFSDEPAYQLPKHDLKKYHSWLLDKYTRTELIFHYNEGNLTAEELREWNDLVRTMPSLLQEAQKEKQLTLRPQLSETFGEKVLLKREEAVYEITKENYTTYFIQYYETKELALHLAITGFLVKYPELRADFEQYGKLYLKPDLSVTFEEKNSLKKREKVVAMYWWRYAAAAVVVLAVWFLYPGDESKTTLQSAQNNPDSLEQNHPLIPEQNTVSPHNVIAEDQDQHLREEKLPEQGANHYAKEQEHKTPKEQKQKKENPLPKEENQEPKNIVRDKSSKDSVMTPPVPMQKEDQPMANNSTGNGNKNGLHGNDRIQTVDNPAALVSAVVNKKYYEAETPRQQTSSTFYAMRNVVHTVSGGQADVDKKEDKNSKEFSVRIGNFGFSRKKHK